MDSFAALALATEPPSEKLLDYPPQGKEESLITPVMLKNMLGHAAFQTALLLWLTMTESGSAFFGEGVVKGSDRHYTIVFTSFVALQVFNLFNCRATHDEWNVLAGFSDSVIGQLVLAIICITQWVMVQYGGQLMQTEALTGQQWALCILLGFLSIPVGYALKLVPLADRELRSNFMTAGVQGVGAGGLGGMPSTPLYADSSDVRATPALRNASIAAAAAERAEQEAAEAAAAAAAPASASAASNTRKRRTTA